MRLLYPDALIEINHAHNVSMKQISISYIARSFVCKKCIVISDSSNYTTAGSERDLTSIKKCGDQLLDRELCRKSCAFYQGSWYVC